MAFTKLDNGHLIPLPEDRIAFAQEISMFVALTIFRGQREIRANINGRIATLTMPQEAEILDFLTLTETTDPNVIDVHLSLPVIMGEQRYAYDMCVRYSPLLGGGESTIS